MNITMFWLFLGVIFLIAEMLTPTFFIMWFGLGAFAAMVISLIWKDSLIAQTVIFIIVALILVLLTRKLAQKISGTPSRNIAQDDMIGKTAFVVEDIAMDGSKGLVQLGSEQWKAKPSTDQAIPKGTKVRVIELKGVTLTVEIEKQN